MSDYSGAWRKEEPKEVIPPWDFAAYRKSSPEGPWNGVEDLFPEGKSQRASGSSAPPLPRSAKGFLGLAREHGWGFGPISLVMRLNRKDAQPLYVSWLYGVESGRWSFAGAGLRNGHLLKKAGEAEALISSQMREPDYSRYEADVWDDRLAVFCRDCGEENDRVLWDETHFPELLRAIEEHEKECHGQ